MQIHDFADLYRTKSDEELLLLSRDANQLTLEARIALTAELATRRLSPQEQTTETVYRVEVVPIRADSKTSGQLRAEVLAETHQLYRANFWRLAGLAAPAVVIGFAVITLARTEVQEIVRNVPGRPMMAFEPTKLLGMFLLTYSSYLVSWLAGCFSFAAICIAIQQIKEGAVPSLRSCFGDMRARTLALLGSGLLLYLLCIFAFGVSILVSLCLIGSVWTRNFNALFLFYPVLALSLLALTRLGLAIPAVVLDGCTIRKAFFRSDELTEKSWLLLAVLLGESLIGGYFAGQLPFLAVRWLPVAPQFLSNYPWLLTAASLACVTAVEPPMFIGFTLLYLKKTEPSLTRSEQGVLNLAVQ